MKKYFLGLLLCLLCACSSYTATPMGDDVYKLSITQKTQHYSQEKIQRAMLKHSAEITLSAGDRYFIYLRNEQASNGLSDTVVIKTFKNKPKTGGVYDAEAIYNSIAGYRAVKKLHKKLIVSHLEEKPKH